MSPNLQIQPTHKTAALAGAWTALGMVPFGAWMDRYGPSSILAANALWLLAAAVFLLVPGYYLVLRRHAPFLPNWFTDKQERARYGVIVKRMLVWFNSGGACLALLSLLPIGLLK